MVSASHQTPVIANRATVATSVNLSTVLDDGPMILKCVLVTDNVHERIIVNVPMDMWNATVQHQSVMDGLVMLSMLVVHMGSVWHLIPADATMATRDQIVKFVLMVTIVESVLQVTLVPRVIFSSVLNYLQAIQMFVLVMVFAKL